MPDDLASLGEDALIQTLTKSLPAPPDLITGPGDDCAVIRTPDPTTWRLLKTDCVIEGVHYLPGTEPERTGWKAAARAVSDFAAMGGGRPEHALITLVLPPSRTVAWAKGLYHGLQRCAAEFGFAITGGETSRPPSGMDLSLVSVSLSGTIAADRCLHRSGAQPGDRLWVTGELGRSLVTGKHLDFIPRLAEAAWLSQHATPTAMMDLSDGIARDLPRMARLSQAGFRLDHDTLPLAAGASTREGLYDGEDYELLFTAPPETDGTGWRARWEAAFPDLPLTPIGTIVNPDEGESLEAGGWDPFRSPEETTS